MVDISYLLCWVLCKDTATEVSNIHYFITAFKIFSVLQAYFSFTCVMQESQLMLNNNKKI